MNIVPTEIQDLVIIEPKVFGDERGYFMETYAKKGFYEKVIETDFIQDNEAAIFVYMCDNYYAPSYQRGIRYNDATLNIDWQIPAEDMIISEKDRNCDSLADAELFNVEEDLYA